MAAKSRSGSIARAFGWSPTAGVLLVAVGLVAVTAASAKPRSSTTVVAGNTVHGFEPDGEYYDYYAPNGSASSLLNGGDVTHGRWWMQEGNLCVSYPGDAATCYGVQLSGSRIVLSDPNGTVLPGEILRGNPKGL